jgi:hypothetical protein
MPIDKPMVQLVGLDGNAFSILARVKRALQDAGRSSADVSKYMEQAMSGDYDNLLRVTMDWVEVE